MAEYVAGSASVPITPDFSKFHDKVKAQFAEEGDDAGKAFGGAFQDQLKVTFADLPNAKVTASADTATVTADLDAAAKDRTTVITPTEDAAAVSKVGADFDWMARDRAPKFTPAADVTAATVKLDTAAKPRTVPVKADADTTAAEAKLTALTKTRTATVKVAIDKEGLKSLALPALIVGGVSALGPSAVGAALGITGIGVALGAAAADAVSFGAVAKGMFTDVTTAQKALTKAQQDYKAADNSADRVKALQEEKAAVDGLTPSEQALLTQLTGLEGAWTKLSLAEQPAVGAAIAPWLQTATDGMRLLSPLITDASNAIELLGNEADAAIQSPFWTTFSTTLGQTGEEALQVFGTAVGQVADGLAHLFVTFAPDIDNVLPLVDKLSGAFDKWAGSVTSTGLDNFFKTTFSPANVAALKTDLGNLATVLENIAKATGQLSPTAFSGLSNLLAVAAKLSPDQLEALAILYAGSKAVGGPGNLAKVLTGGATLALPGAAKKTTATTEKTGTAAEDEKTAAKGGKLKAVGTGVATAAGGVLTGASVAAPALLAGRQKSTGAKLGNVGQAAAGGAIAGATVGSVVPILGTGVGAAVGAAIGGGAAAIEQFQPQIAKAWSISYEAFQVEFAGKITAWFTQSLPHFFTGQIPDAWSTVYENFQREFAGPITNWFTVSLPHFFTAALPDMWSTVYENFERDVGTPIANWFTQSLPHFFDSAASAVANVGRDIANGIIAGWNATEGAVTAAFGAAKNWVMSQFTGAVSWLQGIGNDIATGLSRAWDATEGAVTADFAKAKTWVLSQFTGALSWLTAAGNDIATGLGRAWNATEGAVVADFAKAKTWVLSQFTGALSWLTAAGNDVATGFGRAWNATQGAVTADFAKAKGWVTSAFAGAETWLTNAGTQLVNGLVNAIKASPGIVESALLSLVPASLQGAVSSALGFAGFASGTPYAPPGWAWVGEHGPELVKFRGGEQVKTAGASAAMAGQMAQAQSMAALSSLRVPSIGSGTRLPGVSSPLSGGQLQLNVNYVTPQGDAIAGLVQGFQFHIQGLNGGDVQGAMGHGPVRIQ